jgi:hypothetical protein
MNIDPQFKLAALRARKRIISTFCRMLYRDTQEDIKKCIFLAGVARSGTTWIADIIRSQIPCRLIWEPFNPHRVRAFSCFREFKYLRLHDQDPPLSSYVETVMNGRIRNHWVDRELDRIFFDYRLIKDVRANLFLRWLQSKYPEVPLIFIMRHPCAVVLSRMEANWGADEDIQAFLSQDKLIEDFLDDKMHVIKEASTEEEKHAIVWAIQNLVPIWQYKNDVLNVVFYENLCLYPEAEIPKVFQIIGKGYRDSVFEIAEKPSKTSKLTSAVITGEDKVTKWKSRLSNKQISSILRVVEAFGLESVYGESCTPLVEDLALV